MAQDPDLYGLLGLPRDATADEIRQAYHAAARRFHPDANPQRGLTELFLGVQEAYEILSNPEMRSKYDRQLPALSVEGPVAFTAQYSRQTLPALGEEQILYALLDFSAPPQKSGGPERKRPVTNLCLVLDRSTSMQGVRMDMVKAAAIEVARRLNPEDFLAVVTFSDRAEVIQPSGRQAARQELETRIRMIRTGGATELLQGLEAGLLEVRRHLRSGQANHLVLLTDGRTYGDEAACLGLAERAAAIGVSISCLGIGEEWNDLFMDELTVRTGGSSRYVAQADNLGPFLQEKFSRLSSAYAEQANLRVELCPGVALNYAFRVQPEAMPLPAGSDLSLGSIPQDAPLSVLLEFILPPLGKERRGRFTCATGVLSLVITSQGEPVSQLKFELSRAVSQTARTEPTPEAVRFAVSHVSLYRMQEQARQEAFEGKIESAGCRLQHLATALLAQGERDLARTALMEAENLHHNQRLSGAGEKRVKFGTRALLLPAAVERDRR